MLGMQLLSSCIRKVAIDGKINYFSKYKFYFHFSATKWKFGKSPAQTNGKKKLKKKKSSKTNVTSEYVA